MILMIYLKFLERIFKYKLRKIALSGLGFDSTQVEADLMSLKYDIGTGRARKIVPYRDRDTNPITRVEKSFEILIQSSIDHISKDLVENISHDLQLNLMSDRAKKNKSLITFNKQFAAEN